MKACNSSISKPEEVSLDEQRDSKIQGNVLSEVERTGIEEVAQLVTGFPCTNKDLCSVHQQLHKNLGEVTHDQPLNYK